MLVAWQCVVAPHAHRPVRGAREQHRAVALIELAHEGDMRWQHAGVVDGNACSQKQMFLSAQDVGRGYGGYEGGGDGGHEGGGFGGGW